MNTDIEIAKKAIVMKSGLVFWVEAATADKFESAVTAPEFQHQFVMIKELKQTINTAQIEGFYTAETMLELEKIKRGEKKCAYGNFHKRIDDCDCLREQRRAREEQQKKDEAREEAEREANITPEERKRVYENNLKDTEMRALNGSAIWRGMFAPGGRTGKRMRRSTIKEWEKINGRKADLDGIMIETTTPVARAT